MLAFIATVVTIAFIILTNFYSHVFLELLVNGNVSHLPLLKEPTAGIAVRTHCSSPLSLPHPVAPFHQMNQSQPPTWFWVECCQELA